MTDDFLGDTGTQDSGLRYCHNGICRAPAQDVSPSNATLHADFPTTSKDEIERR